MSLEIDVTLECESDFDLNMSELEYIGSSDHDKLKNRDMVKQHPISAIDGLEQTLGNLQAYCKTLADSITSLDSNVSKDIESIKKTVDNDLKNLTEDITKKIENLANTATADEVKEVLNNGD